MPPAVQKVDNNFSKIKEKRSSKAPDSLICLVKYTNNLPDIPFDPKFLKYSFGPERFIQYNPTSLERNYKHDLLTESNVGVEVDLIDPIIFQINPNDKLHPDDEILLEDELSNPLNSKRSRHHNKFVSWMRKTEYISTERSNNYKADKPETKSAFQKRLMKNEHIYRDRQSQLKAIEETFLAAKDPIVNHYSKPNVVATSILPILPDFKLWKHPCAQVIFDDDPIGKNTPHTKNDFSGALIRGMVDEEGQNFVAYFLPTEETRSKLKRRKIDDIISNPDETYNYRLAREYNWNVQNKGMENYNQNYFFLFNKNGAFYNGLETRVRLSKRRKTGMNNTKETKLIVKNRDFNDSEFKSQADRLMMLEQDEEIYEDDQQSVEEEKEAEVDGSIDDVSETVEKNLNDQSVSGSESE